MVGGREFEELIGLLVIIIRKEIYSVLKVDSVNLSGSIGRAGPSSFNPHKNCIMIECRKSH